MSCNSVRQWFSDYRDGQPLPVWSRLLVWLHLHVCPRCQRVERSMQATDDALEALRDQPPPAGG